MLVACGVSVWSLLFKWYTVSLCFGEVHEKLLCEISQIWAAANRTELHRGQPCTLDNRCAGTLHTHSDGCFLVQGSQGPVHSMDMHRAQKQREAEQAGPGGAGLCWRSGSLPFGHQA